MFNLCLKALISSSQLEWDERLEIDLKKRVQFNTYWLINIINFCHVEVHSQHRYIILKRWPASNLALARWGSGRWFLFTPAAWTPLSLCATAAQCVTHHTRIVQGHDLLFIPETHTHTHLLRVRMTELWKWQVLAQFYCDSQAGVCLVKLKK